MSHSLTALLIWLKKYTPLDMILLFAYLKQLTAKSTSKEITLLIWSAVKRSYFLIYSDS